MRLRGHRFPIARCPRTTRHPFGLAVSHVAGRDWLTHSASLTARIRGSCREFHVQLLGEGPRRILHWERRLLKSAARIVHVREVLLIADGVAVVWARTVLDRRALRGAWRFLRVLGTRPLGARLFHDPAIQRSRFAYLPGRLLAGSADRHASIAASPVTSPGADRSARPLGSRSVLLARRGTPALLIESLLPAVLMLQPLQTDAPMELV